MENHNDTPSILYYYCNINEFIDIITNKRLILKDLQKIEPFSCINNIIEIVNQRIKIKEKILFENLDLEKMYIHSAVSGLKKQLDKYNYGITPFLYALILTSNVNKWHMYKGNSYDLCIGIRTDLFEHFKGSNIIWLKKISYNIKELEDKIDEKIENYMHENRDNDAFNDSFKNIWTYINNDLVYDAACYKNGFFSDENGYMLILDSKIRKLFLENNDNFENMKGVINYSFDNKISSLSKLNFMTENNQLISYRYFGHKNLLSLIESVYVNPVGEMTESDIRQLLSTKNVNHKNIKIEKTPLK